MTKSGIELTDEAAGTNAVAPRISLAEIESRIAHKHVFIAGDAVSAIEPARAFPGSLSVLTICLLTMDNGFTVIGKSAPASEDNFSAELGAKFAYENAISKLWPLMGFELRTKLFYED